MLLRVKLPGRFRLAIVGGNFSFQNLLMIETTAEEPKRVSSYKKRSWLPPPTPRHQIAPSILDALLIERSTCDVKAMNKWCHSMQSLASLLAISHSILYSSRLVLSSSQLIVSRNAIGGLEQPLPHNIISPKCFAHQHILQSVSCNL